MDLKSRKGQIEDAGGADSHGVLQARRKKFGLNGSASKADWMEGLLPEKKVVKRERPEIYDKPANLLSSSVNYRQEIEERRRSDIFKEALSKAFGMKSQDNFVARLDPDYLDPLIEIYKDTIHLYGVDFMDTASINNYFSHFEPKQIIWIDASSASIVFDSPEIATRAFFANLRNQPPTKHEKYIRGETNPKFDPFEPRDQLIDSEWLEMLPTYAFGVERKLFARFATSQDKPIKDPAEDIRSEKAMLLVRCMNLIRTIKPSKRYDREDREGDRSRHERYRSRSTSRNRRSSHSSRDSGWSRSSTASTEEAFVKYIEEGRKRQKKG